MKSFEEIDEILVKHSVVRYNFDILNPLNREEEFEKFQEDPTYNPQFEYNSFDASEHIVALESLDIDTSSSLGKLFEAMRTSLLIEAKALHHIGTDTYDTTHLFTPVPEYVLTKAKEILSHEDTDEEPDVETITDEELAQRMREQLLAYGCDDWIVSFSEHAAARVSVSAGKKQVTIKKDELFSQEDVIKLLAHEIGVHVLRALNGEEQQYKIFSLGIPGYLATEEGLAGYSERVNGIEKDSVLRYYALSAIITDLCSQQGFVEVYNQVREYFDDDWACFKAVARPKRGLGNTSKPGGYLKDHCYLEGLLVIEKFVEEGGSIKDLYTGKIGVQHLHYLTEGILKPASVIPDFFK